MLEQNKKTGLQEQFLGYLRKKMITVTIFLVNGVRLEGELVASTIYVICIRRGGQLQLIFKQAIATFCPKKTVNLHHVSQMAQEDPSMTENTPGLQEIFLNYLRKNLIEITLFLVNGIKLQGRVKSFDTYCLVLERPEAANERPDQAQLIYKHSIATLFPMKEFNIEDVMNSASLPAQGAEE